MGAINIGNILRKTYCLSHEEDAASRSVRNRAAKNPGIIVPNMTAP